MKNEDEMIAAFRMLWRNAENDFERHRIESLVRDLVEPPKVEVIDEKHQRFNDKIYTKMKNGRYYRHNALHRDVWEYHNGAILDDDDIHHVDFDTDNNDIENLQKLTNAEHARLHLNIPVQKSYICKVCGKTFVRRSGKNLFCSKKCAYIAEKKKYLEERNCQFCGEIFLANRYGHQKFCSRTCAMKQRAADNRKRFGEDYFKKRKLRMEKRICVICGAEFETRKYRDAKTCSKSCAGKLHHQNFLKKKANKT